VRKKDEPAAVRIQAEEDRSSHLLRTLAEGVEGLPKHHTRGGGIVGRQSDGGRKSRNDGGLTRKGEMVARERWRGGEGVVREEKGRKER
jgi:hypothetical protein